MVPSSPRILVASRRLCDANVWSAATYEFEDLLAGIAGAQIVGVSTKEARPRLLERTIGRGLDRLAGLSFDRKARWDPVDVEDEYDLLIVRAMTPQDLDFMDGLRGWRERCKVAVCWIEELWISWLGHDSWMKRLSAFDHVFVEQALTVDPLQRRLGKPCHYVGPAVDALSFCPYPDQPARSIDLYAMGRRSAKTHAAALSHAAQTPGFMYLYDSLRPAPFVNGATEHRMKVISLVQRTRYFMANRAKADTPDQNEGQQEYGPRFFEGAAAGAILVGEPPKSQVFDEAFDWPDALVPLPFDSEAIGDLLRDLDSQPERMELARRANVVNSLRRHDWVYRWEEILRPLGVPLSEAATRRVERLESSAAAVEGAEPTVLAI